MLAKSFFDKKMLSPVYRIKFQFLGLIQYIQYLRKTHKYSTGELNHSSYPILQTCAIQYIYAVGSYRFIFTEMYVGMFFREKAIIRYSRKTSDIYFFLCTFVAICFKTFEYILKDICSKRSLIISRSKNRLATTYIQGP